MASRRKDHTDLRIVELAVDPADVARKSDTWTSRLERVQSRADELEGENWIADSRRLDEQTRHGSHLRSQQADERGLH